MARLTTPPSNFADVLTISEAADFLGVSTATLRNWDRSGKLKPRRHPQNGYRIYLHEDLEAVLRSADLSTLVEETFAPQVDWDKIRDSEHFVQFYENDDFLIESVGRFTGAALRDRGSSVTIATPEHCRALERKLVACGIDVDAAKSNDRYVVLDARETLSRFIVGSTVDAKLFDEVIGSVMGRLANNGRRVHAFGEMVALLWADENREAAIELEQAWNKLAGRYRFALLCAYPISGFYNNGLADGLQDVCSCHSRVIPAESYSAADTDDKRLRAITLLQQKAQSLEAEIEHRCEVEKSLANRERELADSNRRKDVFLATLSHELRNPLAPIRNSLALLEANTCDKATRKEAGSVIKRQVEQLTRLVDDLLDLSRVTRDKVELRKEVVDVASIIYHSLETSRPSIEAAGHELKIDLPERPLHLEVDPARMAQVFSNLLNNASKFTEPGGVIEINAKQQGSEVTVSIGDNGIGIPCEELAHVFDVFRQVDQSLEKSHGGLGIGLTLVRRLVELHGGTVNAQSEGPDKGSEFTVRLPLAKGGGKQVRSKTAKSEDISSVSKFRILVVDDNLDSGRTLSLLLKLKGHEVRTAGDGLEAIAAAEEFRPDIILMDVGMPKLNGYEATRRIREKPFGKDILIVALTGWGQASDVARSIEAGCSAHLVKPVDFAELERLLRTAKK